MAPLTDSIRRHLGRTLTGLGILAALPVLIQGYWQHKSNLRQLNETTKALAITSARMSITSHDLLPLQPNLDHFSRAVEFSRNYHLHLKVWMEDRLIAESGTPPQLSFFSQRSEYVQTLPDGTTVRVQWEIDYLREVTWMALKIAFIQLLALLLWIATGNIARRKIERLTNPVREFVDDIEKLTRALERGSEDLTLDTKYEVEELESLKLATNTLLSTIHRLQEGLTAATRNAAMGEMARQVAHDIRSPLSALFVLMDETHAGSEEKNKLLRSAILRIKEISDDLLTQNRAANSASAPRPHLLLPLCEEILAEKRVQWAHQTRASIVLATDPASACSSALVSAPDLKRILSNLLDNSFEASGDGPNLITLSLRASRTIELAVQDTGSGIPASILDTLGKPGVSHGKCKGNGIGLFHAKRLVADWGGSLTIQSELGQGTRVALSLQPSLSEISPATVSLPQSATPGDVEVLIVHDDPNTRIKEWLSAKALGKNVEVLPDFASLSSRADLYSKAVRVRIGIKDEPGEPYSQILRDRFGFQHIEPI